jgi:monoamine oxidase
MKDIAASVRRTPPPTGDARAAEHFDVLIVGVGLSGIGAACRLQAECPSKTFLILEGPKVMGGTWDLFRYPGVRPDSDMFTLGYCFRPWREAKAIADGSSILTYIRGYDCCTPRRRDPSIVEEPAINSAPAISSWRVMSSPNRGPRSRGSFIDPGTFHEVGALAGRATYGLE